MRKHFIQALAGLAFTAIFVAAAPSFAETLSVEHASGTTDVKQSPKRVLVYDLGALETLDWLGVEVTGVPGSNVPPSLAKYKDDRYLKVGTLFEPDYEAVNAAEPDLIIIGARTREKFKELSAMAPTIDLTLDAHDAVTSIKKNAEILGRIFGKEADVEQRIEKLDASIAALKKITPDVGTGLVLLTTGGKISAYGKGSRFGELHDQFGVTPADPNLDVAVHGEAISYEYILEKNPDWLFVIDRDAAIGHAGQSAHTLLDNELVHETKAWKNGHVVYLDPVQLYLTGSGLASEQGIVDQLLKALSQP